MVLKSTVKIVSVHGKKKNKPGPLVPPGKILPSRIITARSNSWTIYSNNLRKIQVCVYKQNLGCTSYFETGKQAKGHSACYQNVRDEDQNASE